MERCHYYTPIIAHRENWFRHWLYQYNATPPDAEDESSDDTG